MATSSSSSSSSPEKLHRSLLSDLQSDFLGEKVDDNRTFQKWKQFLKLVYEGPRYQDTSVFDDFNQLEKDGKLGVGEYGILKKILKHVDQRAVTKVEETEKDIKKLRERYQREESSREENGSMLSDGNKNRFCNNCKECMGTYKCSRCFRCICLQCYKTILSQNFNEAQCCFEFSARFYPCQHHSSNDCDQVCHDCKKPICSRCKTDSHRDHNSTGLCQFYRVAQKRFSNEIKAMKAQKIKMEKVIKQDEFFNEQRNNIRKQANDLQVCVLKNLKHCISEIDKAEKQFNNGNEELLERHNRLEQNIMSYEEELETLDPIEFYFRQPKYQDSKLPEEIELLYFDHSNIDPKCVQDLFGKLTLKKNPVFCKKIQSVKKGPIDYKKVASTKRVEKLGSAKTVLPPIPPTPSAFPSKQRSKIISSKSSSNTQDILTQSTSSFVRTSRGLLEIPECLIQFKSRQNHNFHIVYTENIDGIYLSGDCKNIFLYTHVSKKERVEFPSVDIDTLTEPQGLTLAPSGHLVFSDGDSTLVEKQILIHDSTRNKLNIITRKLKKFQDYEMWGIFCTKNGEYLICLIPYPSAKSEKLFAKVVKLNQDGQQQEFRQDEQGKVLFSKPRFVCENKLTSDICVSDIENMVIVLEKNGKFRGRYNGRLPSSCKDPFAPRGIDSDSLGNILVADVNNDFVHLLDKDVQFITHILSSINPVLQPWGLHVDYKDRVWVVERNNHKGFEKKYATVRAFQIHIKTVTEKGALSLDLL